MTTKNFKWKDVRDDLIEMVKAGKTKEQIAEHYGKSVKSVEMAMYHMDVHMRYLRGEKTLKQYIPELQELAKEGLTIKQIAQRIGLSYTSVRSALASYGISLRRYRQQQFSRY